MKIYVLYEMFHITMLHMYIYENILYKINLFHIKIFPKLYKKDLKKECDFFYLVQKMLNLISL